MPNSKKIPRILTVSDSDFNAAVFDYQKEAGISDDELTKDRAVSFFWRFIKELKELEEDD